MTLTLAILRCPDSIAPETRSVGGGEFTIGRGPDNNWVLADPDRVLSKRHCVLAFRAGGWQVADTSTNGTFLNRDSDPLGPGAPRDLRDGDRIRLGAYEIEIRIAEDAHAGFAAPAPAPAHQVGGFGNDPFSPFAPAAPIANPFGEPAHPAPASEFGFGAGPSPVALPDDFNPLDPGFGMPAGAPTQPDHMPAIADAFAPPRPAPAAIPDDWDLDLARAPTPPPVPTPAPAPPPPPTALASEPPPAAVPRPPASVSTSDNALLAAFLEGAGMPGVDVGDQEAKMRALGEAFRALVGGVRHVLIARAAIKGEFRIEQTQIRRSGNNPLKFSTSDDDALAALLGAGRRADMAPASAVADALRDIRLHELASMAAMQTGVRALLARLDPAALRQAADEAGGIGLPGARKGRAWDAFERLHGQITQALSDDFDSVFGKAFARAYEQALEEAAAKEKQL
jgi:type VI secretion system protein ImpI/type VI secretion system protein